MILARTARSVSVLLRRDEGKVVSAELKVNGGPVTFDCTKQKRAASPMCKSCDCVCSAVRSKGGVWSAARAWSATKVVKQVSALAILEVVSASVALWPSTCFARGSSKIGTMLSDVKLTGSYRSLRGAPKTPSSVDGKGDLAMASDNIHGIKSRMNRDCKVRNPAIILSVGFFAAYR